MFHSLFTHCFLSYHFFPGANLTKCFTHSLLIVFYHIFFFPEANFDKVFHSLFTHCFFSYNFFPGANLTKSFGAQRLFEPHGPLVNSEYYPGWLDHWGDPHSEVSTEVSIPKGLTHYCLTRPFFPILLKYSFLKKEGIIEEISLERRYYESVDEKNLS